MPHLCLCVDEDTLGKIKSAARVQGKSVSKWVVSKLKETVENSWPDGYANLLGAITDDTLRIERNQPPRAEFFAQPTPDGAEHG